MPPPHLAVLNPQTPEETGPARGRLAWLRASLATSFERSAGASVAGDLSVSKPRLLKAPPLLGKGLPALGGKARPTSADRVGSGAEAGPQPAVLAPPAPASDAVAPALAPPPVAPAVAVPAPLPQAVAAPAAAPAPRHELLARAARVINDDRVEAREATREGPPRAPLPPTPEHLPMAKPRPPRVHEDLLADLPPAQVPLRNTVAPLQFSTPVPRPVIPLDGQRAPAAERAFRVGRQGARPAHAMSAAEVAAWREGAMEAGRARDPIIGVPRLWWWLALSMILVLPLGYCAGWLGLPATGGEFLSTPMGQEAWIVMGGPNGAWLYWGLLLIVALVAQLLRPLEPVLILVAATWWGWTALHAAWVAGWLAQRIPPLPVPG